jgi:hypothetical protein
MIGVFGFSETGGVLFATGLTESKCGAAVEGVRLCVRTNKTRYRLGEDIVLVLHLKNESDEDKNIVTSSSEYDFTVKNETSGEIAQPASDEKNPYGMLVSARHPIELKTKKNLENEIVISNKYDFSQVGKYVISVNRMIPKSTPGDAETQHLIVTSNKLQIEVVD